MVKTILSQVKEFKKDSLLTPVFMILEVIMEMVIPLLMAAIIDNGARRVTINMVRLVIKVFLIQNWWL